jgi:aspartate/methionine/tyrosine aminotransferase
MWFQRMTLEIWFDAHQYRVDHDIGESAVRYSAVADLGIDLDGVALRYGHHAGRPDLRELIAGRDDGLGADDVVVTTGASEANFAVVSALVHPGDHVLIEHPTYPSLYEVPRSLGCDVTLFTLDYDDGFRPDLERFEALIRPETKLISFTHPNNPTGSMITFADLEALVGMAERHGTHLMFDETYREMSYPEPLPTAAVMSDRAITISTMSKTFGLPGIRIGWVASRDPAIAEAMVAIREQITITNNAVGEEIAVGVLERREEFLGRTRAHVEQNREIAAAWMADYPYLEWVPPEAGVVAFPRIKDGLDLDPEDLYRDLVDRYRTFVVPGRCFEMDNRHFRLGFGSTKDDLETGLANLGAAIDEAVGGVAD